MNDSYESYACLIINLFPPCKFLICGVPKGYLYKSGIRAIKMVLYHENENGFDASLVIKQDASLQNLNYKRKRFSKCLVLLLNKNLIV